MNSLTPINYPSSKRQLRLLAGCLALILVLQVGVQVDIHTFELPLAVTAFSLLGILIVILMVRMQKLSVYIPLVQLREYMLLLAQGNMEMPTIKDTKQEIHLVVTALNELVEGSKRTADFAKAMGKGDFNTEYKALGADDLLGNSLLEMRTNMVAIAEDEKKRAWQNEGLAKFSELLRLDTNDILKFSDTILTHLVKYLGANQGTFYVLNEEEGHLTLTACYAWGRKKHLESQVRIGEGLTGQVVLEKETIFMTEVPHGYLKITSGLGEANPNCIILMPLKYNEEVFGVIELASFNVFEPYQREFLDKLCVSIASAISTVKVNVRTQKLLDDSILQSQELKEKDGMMRQNIEEMRATQEEMQRKEVEMKHMEWKTNAILEGCMECIIAFNQKGNIEFFNKAAQDIWGMTREDAIGVHVSTLLPIEIEPYLDNCATFYKERDAKKMLTGKAELNIMNQKGEEVTLLCSISKNVIGGNCFFTAFIQNMTVDIF